MSQGYYTLPILLPFAPSPFLPDFSYLIQLVSSRAYLKNKSKKQNQIKSGTLAPATVKKDDRLADNRLVRAVTMVPSDIQHCKKVSSWKYNPRRLQILAQ